MVMISSHPMDLVNVNAGIDVSFSVTAIGGELVYQWMKDGVDIVNNQLKYTGTDSNSLTVLSVNDPDDEGAYSVTVGNTAVTVTSNNATLSIGKSDVHACMHVLANNCRSCMKYKCLHGSMSHVF